MSAPIGVLLAQVGTPAAPTAQALRPYLQRFLSDPRIIDYSAWFWQPILQLILLTRPAKSAANYAKIWTPEGSPLMVYSLAQRDGLQAQLGNGYKVELGLAYSAGMEVADGIRNLEAAGCQRIIVLPLFPQYSTTTTAAAYDEAMAAALGRSWKHKRIQKKYIPALRFVEAFYSHPGYLPLLKQHVQAELSKLAEAPDFFLISFHGVPQRYETQGDPYRGYCTATAQLLAKAMNWGDNQWQVAFQSQFGPETWLKPSTQELLPQLHARGIRRPCIIAPGFTTDCIETLEELAEEGRELWENGGGSHEALTYLPCLNASSGFIELLTTLVRENAVGWERSNPTATAVALAATLGTK